MFVSLGIYAVVRFSNKNWPGKPAELIRLVRDKTPGTLCGGLYQHHPVGESSRAVQPKTGKVNVWLGILAIICNFHSYILFSHLKTNLCFNTEPVNST
jgi:hypothetical protein